MNRSPNRISISALVSLILCLSLSAAQEQTVVSRIDSKCQRTRAEFQVPPGKVAQYFRLGQLDQGVGCETGSLIDYQRFAIKNAATEKIIYSYDRQRGGVPQETPVLLSRLVLPPGKYVLSVAGGAGAVCALSFELSASPASAPGFGSVRALIDKNCLPHCGAFTVPAFAGAQNFRISGLDPGANCHTGQRIEMKSFRVENEDTGETLFRYIFYSEQNIVEWPVKLTRLSLGPGNYRLCLSGGKDAFCILEYSLVARPGAVPPPPKPRPPKKTAPPAQPGQKQEAKDALWREGVGLIQSLDELEKQVDELEDLIGAVTSLEAADQARQELNRLEAEARTLANGLEELRKQAEKQGVSPKELEELLEENWAELEARPRNLLSDLRFLEAHLDSVEKSLRGQKEKNEEEADATTAEINKWLKYAEGYSQKNRVGLDAGKLQAEMEKNVLRSVPAQATFYQYLFSSYVDCLVKGAQKRSKCKVSGSVTSMKVEVVQQRITYEYVIIEECPEKTYRNPGRGQTTFEQLERWVKDSCGGK
ncbi:MAG: hypothetical protein WCB96_05675 [Candidatus Aminicenantales bacterium]